MEEIKINHETVKDFFERNKYFLDKEVTEVRAYEGLGVITLTIKSK